MRSIFYSHKMSLVNLIHDVDILLQQTGSREFARQVVDIKPVRKQCLFILQAYVYIIYSKSDGMIVVERETSKKETDISEMTAEELESLHVHKVCGWVY